MNYIRNYVKIIFEEKKGKAVRVCLFLSILILYAFESTEIKQNIFGHIHSSPLQLNDFMQAYQNDKYPMVDEKSDGEIISSDAIDRVFSLCQIAHGYWRSNEPDKAIDMLDQAYSTILKIETFDDEDLIRQKEDMRFLISKRINEIYASRKMIIRGSRTEIPVTINQQVQHEIDLYTKGNLRAHFIASYKRSGKYRKMIVDMLQKEGLPQELSWLPLVESGFIVNALSDQRALGLWQFIPSTGHKFGLSRDEYIDERLDPEKSTQAAIDYFKELHSHFGDWSTALAAYNCGETRVLRIIRNQKIKYLDNFWDLYDHLPRETARYVPKYLATLHIVNNLGKYGLEEISIDQPLKFESFNVTKKSHLNYIAEITGIEEKKLEELNPELRQGIVPGKNYTLKVPQGSRQILFANIDNLLRLNPESVNFQKHHVKSGETLSLIASRYSTSVDNIILANNLQSANHIICGKTIKIPHEINTSDQRDIATFISGKI